MSIGRTAIDEARGAAIWRVTAYIQEHPGATHTHQDLADLAAMNKRTFSQLFLTVMGVGVKAYVRSTRVSYAKRLLDQTDLSVAQVMRRSGFVSTDAGRRAFLHIERVAPMLYRCKLRGAEKT